MPTTYQQLEENLSNSRRKELELQDENKALRAKLSEALLTLRAVWSSNKLSKQIAVQNIDVVDGKIGPYEDPLTERVYLTIETLKA
jgi:hypothetical protein